MENLSSYLKSTTISELMRELKLVFDAGFTLFIRYNDYGEYGYQLMFSNKKYDYVRFDNYDKEWEVSTKPHHFHSKDPKSVIESPKNGDPSHDIPILCDFIIQELNL